MLRNPCLPALWLFIYYTPVFVITLFITNLQDAGQANLPGEKLIRSHSHGAWPSAFKGKYSIHGQA